MIDVTSYASCKMKYGAHHHHIATFGRTALKVVLNSREEGLRSMVCISESVPRLQYQPHMDTTQNFPFGHLPFNY